MSDKEVESEPRGGPPAPSEALSAPDPQAALRNAAAVWAEANTRPETLGGRDARQEPDQGAVPEPCHRLSGDAVYRVRERQQWLGKLTGAGARARAERLYSELDHLAGLRREARRAMVAESGRHPASKLLLGVPTLGAVRVARLISVVGDAAPSGSSGPTAAWRCGRIRAPTTGSRAPSYGA